MDAAGLAKIGVPSLRPPAREFNADAIVNQGATARRYEIPSHFEASETRDRPSPDEQRSPPQTMSAPAIERQPTRQQAESPLPTSTVAEPPGNDLSRVVKLSIPAIGLAAPTVPRSIDANGIMETAGPFEVAWYDFSSHPQRDGNAVFSGHVDYVDVGPAVFWNLGNVREGDEIEIALEDGTRMYYRVNAMTVIPAASDIATLNEIIGPTPAPSITLFTCTGQFDPGTGQYQDRLIVRAERITS